MLKYSFLLIYTLLLAADNSPAQDITKFHGTSDASAAIGILGNRFIVADDENNVLRIYKTTNTFEPDSTFDLTDFLAVDNEHPEADIEGAAGMGNIIYWISSHGRNKDGKLRPSRYRFFAIEVSVTGLGFFSKTTVKPVGRPYTALIQQMLKEPELDFLKLDKITQLKDNKDKDLAPKDKGLNIEGLAAGKNGRSLMIGFRNPHYSDPSTGKEMAIIIPLLNPEQVVRNSKTALFGSPILLDLGGNGIRSIEWCKKTKQYYIIAGPVDSGGKFQMFTWSGDPDNKPKKYMKFDKFPDFTPEALFFTKFDRELWILSDDGTLEIAISNPTSCRQGELLENGKCPNKYLIHDQLKTFRSLTIQLAR